MVSISHFLRWTLLAASLAGCASEAEAPGRAFLAPDLAYEMPLPAALGREVDAVQLITARYKGETFTFESRLKITSQTVLLAGVDGFGRRLITISWAGGKPDIERTDFFPPDLRAENILADITLMFWPDLAIQKGLSKSSGTLSHTRTTRTISANGQQIITIQYPPSDPWSGITRLHNSLWGYDLEVRSELVSP